MGKTGVIGHQHRHGTSLKSAKPRNPEISACYPHGQSRWVPNYPGSLRVSGINRPTWGNGGDGGSGLAKAMLVVWPCKLLVLKTQALAWLTLDKALSGQLNRNGKLVSVRNLEEVTGPWESCGLGRDALEDREQVPLRKCFLGFWGSYWEMQPCLLNMEGNELSFTLFKLRLWSLVTTLT